MPLSHCSDDPAPFCSMIFQRTKNLIVGKGCPFPCSDTSGVEYPIKVFPMSDTYYPLMISLFPRTLVIELAMGHNHGPSRESPADGRMVKTMGISNRSLGYFCGYFHWIFSENHGDFQQKWGFPMGIYHIFWGFHGVSSSSWWYYPNRVPQFVAGWFVREIPI